MLVIESDPEILGGKPVIKGTRIPVDLILELVDQGYSVAQIREEYPHLTEETVLSVLRFAKRIHETVSYDRLKKLAEA